MKHAFKGLVAAALLVPAVVSAEGLSYNYAELGLAVYDADGQTPIGPDFRASASLNENVFLYGGLRILSDDIDYTNLYAGAAYRHGLNTQTDLWGGANLEYQDVEVCAGLGGCASDDETSLALRGGVRHQLDSKVEIGAHLRIITGDYDYVGYTGYGRFKASDNLSLKAELDVQDGDLGLFLGGTLFF